MADGPYLAGRCSTGSRLNGLVPVPCRPGLQGPDRGDLKPRPLRWHASRAGTLLAVYGGTVSARPSATRSTSRRRNASERIARFWRIAGSAALGPGGGLDLGRHELSDRQTDTGRPASISTTTPACRSSTGPPSISARSWQAGTGQRRSSSSTAKGPRRGRSRSSLRLAQGPPAFELFTGSKHALVFGLHPASTPAAPVTYRIVRHADRALPTSGGARSRLQPWDSRANGGFWSGRGPGPDLDQAGLERWL